jgi:transcriptional regulator with XRE-family HTH domain
MHTGAKFGGMDHSRQALGRAIRELREARAPKLSQEELGRRAGYRTGAGVSMSRIENGVTRPGPKRLAGIATALGVTVRELETRGAAPSPASDLQDTSPPAFDQRPVASAATPVAARQGESAKERMRLIQSHFERRNSDAVTQAEAFNAAHDRARDEFFLAFVSTARTIRGLPAPAPVERPSSRADGPTSEASLRRQLAAYGIASTLVSGMGAAAADDEADREDAYNAVVATAVLTPPPATAAQPEVPAAARTRATRALLGGATRAGGAGATAATVLAGLATAASPLFAASTLAWLARRSRQQNEALRLQLDEAEANLLATERGFEAVMALLGRATECLGYIAVHGGHAQRRWQSQLPDGPTDFTALSPDQQRQYAAFVEIAACQVCVDTVDMTDLLAASGEQQAALIQVADDILTLAQHHVEALV